MDYTEWLRRLALNDVQLPDDVADADALGAPRELDPKTLALVRLAALVAVRGAGASYGEHVDRAVSAGATAEEIVQVLVAVTPVVGLPCAVAAAPNVALALGYDTDNVFER